MMISKWLRPHRIGPVLLLHSTLVGAAALPLDDYIKQVAASNDGYRALTTESTGAALSSRAADLYFTPQAFAKFEYIRDVREVHSPQLNGDHRIMKNYSAGLRQQTPFGLQFQLSFDANQSILTGTDPTLVKNPELTNRYPVPLFNLSLWQNFLGRTDRANKRLLEARMKAQSFGRGFEARGSLAEAEGRYWKLASLREALRLTNESMSRAKSVYELSLGKKSKELIENSELLLSEAAVQGKKLELKSMQDEERSAARAFNSARGIDSDTVEEIVSLPPADALESLAIPARGESRGDLKAIEQQSIAASAGYEAAREQLLPSLNLYGSIFAYGLMFSVPLDFSATSEARKGFSQQMESADLAYHRKAFEVDNEWKELTRKFADLKERLAIAVKLENIQKRKFEDLSRLRARGLTISFQVFQYELEYMSASLARVQIEGMLLGTWSQLKLFERDS